MKHKIKLENGTGFAEDFGRTGRALSSTQQLLLKSFLNEALTPGGDGTSFTEMLVRVVESSEYDRVGLPLERETDYLLLGYALGYAVKDKRAIDKLMDGERGRDPLEKFLGL